jgi:hypothetical protein
MNTYNFDVTKVETHDFFPVMGQQTYFETTINKNQWFDLTLDEFQENASFVTKIIVPILIQISDFKQKIFPTIDIKVLNKITLTTKLIEYYSPIIRVANRTIANPNLYQHENVIIRVPNVILAFARMILKISDINMIVTNRINVTPSLKRYKLLSEHDPILLSALDVILLKDMEYETL